MVISLFPIFSVLLSGMRHKYVISLTLSIVAIRLDISLIGRLRTFDLRTVLGQMANIY